MKILIIGASGLVGGSIYKYLVNSTDWEIIGTYNNFQVEPFVFFDASARKSWSSFILNEGWDIIIHTGALTNVDRCEEDSELSYRLTVKSVENLSLFASEIGAKLIYTSTDYVFDGECGPYTEKDIPNPINIYGTHKLKSEELITKSLTNYLIVRITNVYGDEIREKNFLSRVITQIKSNLDFNISAPHDQYATPVNALDIAKVILILILDQKSGLYHIASTDYLNRVQFIQKINKYFNDVLSVNPVTTRELNQLAPRPLLGGLIAKKFLDEYPNFQFSNIDDFIKEKIKS